MKGLAACMLSSAANKNGDHSFPLLYQKSVGNMKLHGSNYVKAGRFADELGAPGKSGVQDG